MAQYLGKRPEEKPEGRSILVYGPPFTGKTTSLDDPDVKVFLFDMDHNTSSLEDATNVTIYPVDSIKDYLEGKESIKRGYFMIDGQKIPFDPDTDIVAFDSFTRFEELIKKWVAKEYAPNRKREIQSKFGCQTDWQDLQDFEVDEVREWQALTRSMGFNVIWIGHDMTVTDGMGTPSHVQLALQGKYASSRIMGSIDAVCYFAKQSVPDKENPGKFKVVRGVYTQDHNLIKADVRVPAKKRSELPTFVPNPKWSKILPYLGYKKKSLSST